MHLQAWWKEKRMGTNLLVDLALNSSESLIPLKQRMIQNCNSKLEGLGMLCKCFNALCIHQTKKIINFITEPPTYDSLKSLLLILSIPPHLDSILSFLLSLIPPLLFFLSFLSIPGGRWLLAPPLVHYFSHLFPTSNYLIITCVNSASQQSNHSPGVWCSHSYKYQ